jgi:hypothetical protein
MKASTIFAQCVLRGNVNYPASVNISQNFSPGLTAIGKTGDRRGVFTTAVIASQVFLLGLTAVGKPADFLGLRMTDEINDFALKEQHKVSDIPLAKRVSWRHGIVC